MVSLAAVTMLRRELAEKLGVMVKDARPNGRNLAVLAM